MIIKNFINGQITTGTEPIDPISGVSRGLYINSVLSGNSTSDTLVGLDINPSYSGIAGNYFGLRVSGDTIFATSGGTQVFRTFNNGSVIIGSGTTQSSYQLDVNGTGRFSNQRADDNFIFTLNRSVNTVGVSPRLRWTGNNVGSIDIYGEQNFFTVSASAGVSASSYQGNFINFAANTGTVSEPLIRGGNGYTGGLFFIGGGGVTGNAGIGFSIGNYTEGMRLVSTGNLLIGTTTDAGQKLQVNGSTRLIGGGSTSGTTGFTVVNSSNEVALQVLDNNWIGMQVLSPSAPLHVYYPGTTQQTKTIAIFDGYQNPAQPLMQIQVGREANNLGIFLGYDMPNSNGFIKQIGASSNALSWNDLSNVAIGGNATQNNSLTIYGRSYGAATSFNTTGIMFRTASGTLTVISNSTAIPDISVVGLGTQTIFSNIIGRDYGNVSNLYIDGPPVAGNNTTIINRWSMYVNSGNTYFGGRVMVGLTGDTGFQFTSSGSTLLRGSGTTSGTTSVVLQNSSGGTIATIGDTGYYGINTTLPLANFHSRGLYNELYFQSPTTNSGRHDISFGFGGTGRQVRLIAVATGGGGNGDLYIATASGDVAVATTSNANALFQTGGNTFYKTFSLDQSTLTSGNGLYIAGNQQNVITNGIYFRYSETRVAILSKPTGGGGNADFRIATVPTIGGSGNNPPQESDTKFMITHDTANTLINTTTDLGFKLSVSGSTLLRGSGTTSASYALATQNSSGGTTMVVNNAGNMLIGTTTDAGYKLDVNGTARIQGDSIIWGGGFGYLLRQSGAITYGSTHATVGIQGASSWVLGNDTGVIGSSNGIIDYTTSLTANVEQTSSLKARRMIYGSGEGRYVIQAMDNAPSYNSIGNMYIAGGRNTNGGAHGNVYLGVDLTGQLGGVFVGTKIDNKSLFIVGGTVSGATLSTTRATHINATLLATGNTTTLIGLDIQPTFTPGSFTGLTQIALRVSGGTQIIGSGSTGTTLSLFSVDGASGRLFDVTDDFTNSLFSVNTSSGVPVIEAFANNSIVMGTYGSNALVVSGTSVSVGTNQNLARLFVKSSGTSTSNAFVVQNSSGGTISHMYDNGSATFGTSSNGGFKYRFVDENNLGFQITNGDAGGSTGRGTLIIGENSANGRLQITVNTAANTGDIAYTYNGILSFSVGGSERMRLNQGNLLVGTTSDGGFKLNVNGTSNFSGNMTLGGTATLGSTVIGNSGIAIGDGSSRGTWTVGVGYVVNMSNVVQSLGVGSVVPWMNNSISLGTGEYTDSTSSQMIMVPMAMSATTMSSGSTAELYISNNTQSRLSIPNLSVINAMVTVDYIATCTLTGSSSSLVFNDVKAGTQKFYVKRWFINNVGAYFTISTPVDVYSQSDSAMSGATLSYEYVSASTIKVKFNAPPTANGSTFRCAATVRVTTYKD